MIWMALGQEPTVSSATFGYFSLVYHFSFSYPSLWKMARYRLKCCLKRPLNSKYTIFDDKETVFRRAMCHVCNTWFATFSQLYAKKT